MPANIKIIHAQDFLKATVDGALDLENSKQLLLDIAAAAAPFGEFEILVDTRNALVEMSAFDLWYLAEELGKFRQTFAHKTAILCPLEGFDQAAFFALCAKNRGANVRAFTSFEDAIEWLILEEAMNEER